MSGKSTSRHEALKTRALRARGSSPRRRSVPRWGRNAGSGLAHSECGRPRSVVLHESALVRRLLPTSQPKAPHVISAKMPAKSRRRALVETCSDDPESCDRNAARLRVRTRRLAVLSMIGPNRAAAFNRGGGWGCKMNAGTDKLSEANTTALVLNHPGERDERQIDCGRAWGKTSWCRAVVSFRSPAGGSTECG